MLNDLFAEACDALWGAQWRVAAAEAFGVSIRRVGHWASGRIEIPPEVWTELANRIVAHRRTLAEIAAQFPSAGSQTLGPRV